MTEIIGLPAGAHIQSGKKKRYVYLIDGYEKNSEGTRYNTKKTYIGTVVDNRFFPNATFKLLSQTHSKSPENSESSFTPAMLLTFSKKLNQRTIGPSMLLHSVARECNLLRDLQGLFTEEQINQAISLAIFQVLTGWPYSRFPAWTANNQPLCDRVISSAASTRLCEELGENELGRANFYKRRIERLDANEYISYDSTKILSSAKEVDDVAFGKTKQGGFASEISLAILCGHRSHMPVMMRTMAGNITDVVTVEGLLHRWDCIGKRPVTFVMDRGFSSRGNLEELHSHNINYLMGISTSWKVVKEAIRQEQQRFWEAENYIDALNGYGIRVPAEVPSDPNNEDSVPVKTNLYIFRNLQKAADEENQFFSEIASYEQALKNGIARKDAKCRKFFKEIRTSDSVKWQRDNQKIDEELHTIGFFAVVSNLKLSPLDALEIYRGRDVVEKSFMVLQSKCDLKSARSHHNHTLQGRLFIGFLSLTLISFFYEKMKEPSGKKNEPLRQSYSVDTLLDEFKNVKLVTYPGQKSFLTELTGTQKNILQRLGLEGALDSNFISLYE